MTLDLSNVANVIEFYLNRRRLWGKWKDSDPHDTGIFLMQECSELIKELTEILLSGDGYTRHNPDDPHTLETINNEIAGVLLMAHQWAKQHNTTLAKIATDYLDKKDEKYLAETRDRVGQHK